MHNNGVWPYVMMSALQFDFDICVNTCMYVLM